MMNALRLLLEDLMRNLNEVAKEHVEEHGGHPPVLFLLKKDSDEPEVVQLHEYIDDKDLMGSMMQAYRTDPTVLASVFLSEAWTVQYAKDSPEAKRIDEGFGPPCQPSESPDREEILFYLAETPGGNMSASAPIIRNGKKTTVGPLKIMPPNGTEYRGRLTGNLFNP